MAKTQAEFLFGGDVSGTRILCDIALGSTSPAALEMLGTPRNDRLFHHERLHAKVAVSDRGLIVGSSPDVHSGSLLRMREVERQLSSDMGNRRGWLGLVESSPSLRIVLAY